MTTATGMNRTGLSLLVDATGRVKEVWRDGRLIERTPERLTLPYRRMTGDATVRRYLAHRAIAGERKGRAG